jgi:malate dehydrogenase
MPVVGEQDVLDVHAGGRRTLTIPVDAIVTARALEASRRLEVRLLRGPAPIPSLAVDGGAVLRRGLYRRHPKWVPDEPLRAAHAGRFRRIAFVGAGGVGATAAHLAALSGLADELVLIDIVPDIAASAALDIEHASGISGMSTRAVGSTQLDALRGADVIVVTAGRPRTPGMDRAALLEVNGAIIRQVAEATAAHAPDAVAVIITNPVDEMTYQFWEASGLPPERVLGMAGTLDGSRFRHEIARATDVPPADVSAMTLGSHGAEMVPVVSTATVRGRPLREILSPAEVAACVRATIDGGAAVVRLRRTGSATIAPAHATVEVLDAMRGARAGAVSVSAMLRGEYGIRDVFLGVPAILGRQGLIEVVELPLDQQELDGLVAAGRAIADRLGLAAA